MAAPVLQGRMAYRYDPQALPVASPPVSGEPWTCEQSTYENVEGGPSCTICNAARPANTSLRRTVSFDTEEISSPRHQRETYRKELMVMAPTIQLMFQQELPDTRCSYVVEACILMWRIQPLQSIKY